MSAASIEVRVESLRDETPEVRSFRLIAADGSALPAGTPGAHIDVRIAPGVVRQYSLCNGPGESDHYRIAVKREPQSRGGSRLMHDQVQVGSVLPVSAPKNNFPLDDGDAPSLLVAGGIGITPLWSMAQHLAHEGREFELLYFTRSVAHTAFHAALSAPPMGQQVRFHYALEVEAVRAYLRRRLWHRTGQTQLYLCGPRAFMDLVEQTAAASWPPESVHLEYFSADPQASAGPRSGFLVRLARRGLDCDVREDETIVAALARIGVVVETSCEQGVCGTCLTGVLEGQPDHRDVFLTDDERRAGDKMCLCVSRAVSDVLVLDL